MSASRQEVEIRVYHDRRLGIGPWLESVDPFLAHRPECAVSPELAMGYLLWYLTRTPPTRTAQHVYDQLIAATHDGRFDRLRFAGARGLTSVRVAGDPAIGTVAARDGRRVDDKQRRAASGIARRLASEGVWTLGARAQELIDDAAAHGREIHINDVTDALARIPHVRVQIADRAPSERAARRSPRWAWVSVRADAAGRLPPWLFGDVALALITAARQQISTTRASADGFDRALGTAVAILRSETPPVPTRAAIMARARFAVLLAESETEPIER